MSDCAYSDPKLKKVHYHLHYKKDSAQALNGQNYQNQQQLNISSTLNKAATSQAQIGSSQRIFDTGFIQVDTSQIETIDINQKLLAERDQLRYRIINLEEQLVSSLETQKIEIIRQLEHNYNEQLRQIENSHSKAIESERSQMNSLKQQITEITAQNTTYKENISSLQQTLEKYEQKFEKFSEKSKKEKELMKKSFQEDIEKLQNEILSLKEKVRQNVLNDDKPNKSYYEEQLVNLKAQIQLKVLRIEKLESDNQSLEQQLHQYALDLASLQTQIKIKSQEFDRYTIQRKTSDLEKQIVEQQRQYEKTISSLEEKIDHQKQKIQKLKLQISKVPIKLDPVIVNRPVQVETVVETVKYIPVERVVKEHGTDNKNSVILAQNSKATEKELELIKHYEDKIEQQQLQITQLQRKIDTFSKIHTLQSQTQNAQDQQVNQANETIKKYQQENDFLKQSLQSYEQNINTLTKKYDDPNQY